MDCHNKKLTTFPKKILSNTEWLLLSGNNLGVIDTVPSYLNNIVHLDLSSSNVEEISHNIIKAVINNVQYLDISYNKLKKLPSNIVSVSNLTDLWISGNPFDCNCDMMWMRDWLLEAEKIKDKENVTCALGKLKGTK